MNLDTPAIKLSGVSKAYRGAMKPIGALDNVDLTVSQGEHIAIMGPSGSGKSTLLSLIGCLDRPDSGSYHCLGFNVLELSSANLAAFRNSNIGFVFQNLGLLPRLSVLENVALPFEYSDLSYKDAISRSCTALEKVGMLNRAQSFPRQLSGGQQQRVAVARAMVNKPSLILADEPTGALDEESASEIILLLNGLKAYARTIVVVTHDIGVAKHADRIIYLRNGRIKV
ncbi:ABC transporter ATP-binding protein [Xanthomonas vasicola]|uniref:ABC transporter ATP-binding protein n=1 Tax=Xanthomonas vasicola TaxID=56459 RepID=UPI001FC977E3|nr:ABC transporter ATP-binding protein [Xanthomonas vasicola]